LTSGRSRLPPRAAVEQSQQHRACRVGAPQFRSDLVSLAGEYAGDPADALVGIGGQHPSRSRGEAQLLQGVRQQRQGITTAGIVGHTLGQTRRIESQARPSGRLLDHLNQRRATQRSYRDWVTKQPSLLGAQERGQKLRSHDHDDPQPRVCIQDSGQQAEEVITLSLPGEGDQLLGLVNDHQHRGIRAARSGAKLVRKAWRLQIVGGVS
jgi:hypothetical protein